MIPELERLTGLTIPVNRQGILMLQFESDLAVWQKLVEVRQAQGWALKILERDRLRTQFPQLSLNQVTAAVYSPSDRQVQPVALTHALLAGAERNGAKFQFNTRVLSLQGNHLQTSAGDLPTDYLVISAGLGSTPLTANLAQPVEIRPVLGQAIQVRLEQPLAAIQPVITGNDVHIVPVGGGDYWVGATVEFEPAQGELKPDQQQFESVMQQAIDLCPALGQSQRIRQWYGLRPRPQGRPAPIVEPLPGYSNVLLATGHYRNGVLLAPATAAAVRQAIVGS
jgi:glycine/D-amino acid oxidase-like deaminating enzyme